MCIRSLSLMLTRNDDMAELARLELVHKLTSSNNVLTIMSTLLSYAHVILRLESFLALSQSFRFLSDLGFQKKFEINRGRCWHPFLESKNYFRQHFSRIKKKGDHILNDATNKLLTVFCVCIKTEIKTKCP